MPSSHALLSMAGPTAFRALARAFTHFHDFDRFVQGLQTALDKSDRFEKITVQIDRALTEGTPPFSSGTLNLPLTGGAGRVGVLEVTPSATRRQFGAEDLHLMAGLADFLAATLTQALRLHELEKNRELLRFLLNQAPVGIAAYTNEGSLLVANELAQRWLEEGGVAAGELIKQSGGFHLRASGKLIYGEARRMANDPTGSWIVVMQDLAPEQGRLLELVKRETYRSLVENRRFAFAVVERAQAGEGVLRRLPALRASLLPNEMAGPYDAHRIGVLFPDLDGVPLRARLRRLRAVFGEAAELRLGYAELNRDGKTPEQLLQAALRIRGGYEETLRPALLVHDGNPGVVDMFALVLGKDFRIVKSTEVQKTRELLTAEIFEGFVTELELRDGSSGLELSRYARQVRPGIRPFVTTVQQAPYHLPGGAADPEVVILEKPFDVAVMSRKVRETLLA